MSRHAGTLSSSQPAIGKRFVICALRKKKKHSDERYAVQNPTQVWPSSLCKPGEIDTTAAVCKVQSKQNGWPLHLMLVLDSRVFQTTRSSSSCISDDQIFILVYFRRPDLHPRAFQTTRSSSSCISDDQILILVYFGRPDLIATNIQLILISFNG